VFDSLDALSQLRSTFSGKMKLSDVEATRPSGRVYLTPSFSGKMKLSDVESNDRGLGHCWYSSAKKPASNVTVFLLMPIVLPRQQSVPIDLQSSRLRGATFGSGCNL
jgi:hypothetical protein